MKKEITVDFTEGENEEKIEIKGTVVLKRLSFSERNSLEEEATEIKVFGNIPQVRVSTAKMKEIGIQKSIVSCDLKKTTYWLDKTKAQLIPSVSPISLTINEIKDLPLDVGELLFAEFTNLNELTQKKN